ncbi:cysteine-rich receptor-like protein kinase 44 [Bidens hawaiensis]|uniref:cysteine-rich receptor-like protein kinase 44 n=1 Tax=Bidens hawaiensis TaxID=980011 RepID=UPI004049AA35
MAEVVVSLQSILALQENINNTSNPTSITLFGRKMPTFLSPFNGKNYDRSLKSSESHFDSDGNKIRKLYKFDFLTISIATENFCEANVIWQDQKESMYKGRLQNGQRIAIKKLYGTIHEHIYNELFMKLEHENLVELLGYCLEQTVSFLVYDFAMYKSLDHFIFDPLKSTLLDWNKRHEVILGVANALLYLHKHAPDRIVHADVRPENILFNESMSHKLSYVESEIYLAINRADCINVDKICGIGYMAPEYIVEGYISTKTDVFAFGLLVLETISGQRNYTCYPMTDENFVQYVWMNWLKGTSSSIMDPTLDVDSRLISRFIQIGLLCVQADETDRPTMDEVVGMLVSRSCQDLDLPKNPVSSWIIEEVLDVINVVSDDYDSKAVEEFEFELSPRKFYAGTYDILKG